MEVADAPAVAAVAADGFETFLREVDAVVGEYAIEVEDNGFNGCGKVAQVSGVGLGLSG